MIIMHYCASYWTHQQIIGRDEHSKMNENQCAGPWTFSCNRMQWNIIYYWVGGSVKVVSSAASSRKRWREKIMRERESKIAESEKKNWTEGYIACNGPINNYRSVMQCNPARYNVCLSLLWWLFCVNGMPLYNQNHHLHRECTAIEGHLGYSHPKDSHYIRITYIENMILMPNRITLPIDESDNAD